MVDASSSQTTLPRAWRHHLCITDSLGHGQTSPPIDPVSLSLRKESPPHGFREHADPAGKGYDALYDSTQVAYRSCGRVRLNDRLIRSPPDEALTA